MKKAYQIKVTIMSGRDKGKSYILTKGGYVADENAQLFSDCYSMERAAKAACTRLAEKNKINHELETRDRARREAQGKKSPDWWVYDLCDYEPIEVECFA